MIKHITRSVLFQKVFALLERHAWNVLLGVILLLGFFGVSDMVGGASDLQNGETVLMHSITGMSWNELRAASPKVANLIDLKFRSEGTSLATIDLLNMFVCLIGFRRGERWAWYALWALPVQRSEITGLGGCIRRSADSRS
jgi:hypothetical protein